MTDQKNINQQGSSEESRLAAIARESGLVLLYHGVWAEPPAALAGGLHNVTPDTLGRQLELINRHFTVVGVDEFAAARSRKGLAAVSFDDGYLCVLEEGLPVFEAFEIPFTIYVNGSSFNGQTFWRDKVRFISERDLVEAFEEFMAGIQTPGKRKFYRYTKDPSNNSLHVVDQLDQFIEQRGLTAEVQREHRYCFDSTKYLIAHPLIAYGNHSQSHYVMSSLSPDQQREEIEATAALLATNPSINTSELFSIPFGEERDFDAATVQAARDCGYTGVLLSRAKAHVRDQHMFGLPAFDRLMPRDLAPEHGSDGAGLLASLKS